MYVYIYIYYFIIIYIYIFVLIIFGASLNVMNAMNASADTRCMSQDVRYQFAPVDAGLDLAEVHQLRNVRNGCRYQFYKLVDFPSIELSPNCVKNIT